MNQLALQLTPEIVLVAVALFLFLLGVSNKVAARRLAPIVAVLTLAGLFFYLLLQINVPLVRQDTTDTLRMYGFTRYIKMLAAGVGVMLLLLAWPTNRDGTGNSALNFGAESGEFFGLMLLSICGIFLVAGANDIILLFLGIELASIPTYIMVAISRPLPVAQEAGVKYFFLGAMAAALLLFGFSYLYGATGMTSLEGIGKLLHPVASGPHDLDVPPVLTSWQMMAFVVLLAGLSFKIAAVPMHVYAGDVYQGAATPVTAFLSFVPKTAGFVAIIKILAVLGGNHWAVPEQIHKLIWIIAVLTMTFGNVLGLLQYNIKRLLAYSSIAHTGYMLVGLAALTAALPSNLDHGTIIPAFRAQALLGVTFYLAAYGIMNAAAFGVLMLLPARRSQGWQSRLGAPQPAVSAERLEAQAASTSAETFEDIAGQGRNHVGLGLAMSAACFSLIGIPLTIGFMGKFMLIKPALASQLYWLVVIMMINAAISAAYYLKIVVTLFLRTQEPAMAVSSPPAPVFRRAMPAPIVTAIGLSVVGTLFFGTIMPATTLLQDKALQAASDVMDSRVEPTTHPAVVAPPVVAPRSGRPR